MHRRDFGLGLRFVPRDLAPGHFVLAESIIDRTHAREKSFFGRGFVAHVSLAIRCARGLSMRWMRPHARSIPCERRRHLSCHGSPQFSTLANRNSTLLGLSTLIGMTAMPEASSHARRSSYAIVAMVTDYDCWHEDHDMSRGAGHCVLFETPIGARF